ncbi:hypothetical protein ACIBO1_03535 [Micromonospora sp. NPDC049903]|uniref:hypothetical protein n=1 Tax=Micromonospora sp. NPDC049903 TaxID=3364276 RepID=UPI00378EFB51
MHPHDPYQQQPHQQPYYPPHQYPPQPPPGMYAQQPPNKAGLGGWAIVLWIAVPAILIALCCAGCLLTGSFSAFMEGFNEGFNEGVSNP